MADPLSLTASIIALASAVKITIQGLERIIALKNAPALVLSISHEISELSALLQVAGQAAIGSEIKNSYLTCGLLQMLDRVKEAIQKLQNFIRHQLLRDPDSLDNETKPIEVRWHMWLRKEGKIREIAGVLSDSRQKIASALTAMTAITVMEIPRLNLNLQHATLTNEHLLTSFQSFETNITQRLNDLQLKASLTQSLDKVQDLQMLDTREPPTTDNETPRKSVVEARSPLIRSCSCDCHSTLAMKTPQWLGSTVGSLSIRYNRTASQSCKACNRRSCHVVSDNVLKTQFYFPSWFLHRMISMQFSWNPMSGHTVSLRTPRSISSKSNVFMIAQHGNIEAMQRLFEQRLASPFDISLEEGRSALHFAVTATQPKMVAFLLAQGADPRFEDHNMLSAHDVVWNYLLQMPGSAELELLQSSAGLSSSDTDSLAKRNFTPLHRIVLGLSTLDLKSYLDTTTSDLDTKDSLGKTPLCWAASRPDSETVRLLLEFGANPCLGDHRQQTPLHYCAGSGTAQSMALVLEAAMNEAEYQASKWSRSDAHEGDDYRPDFLREIIDARDSKGRTPLHFATRMNFPEHTRLLLSFGADTECVDAVLDRTTLVSAVYWNSHEVIAILLESGARTDILDSRHASLFHYAARFGDLETLAILSRADLCPLDVDARDDSGYTTWEIFESRHERCITELDDGRGDSIKAFREFMEHMTRPIQSPTHVCTELEIVDEEVSVVDTTSSIPGIPEGFAETVEKASPKRRCQTF